MSNRSIHPIACVPICLLLGWLQVAQGQQAGPGPAATDATAKATQSVTASNSATREELLDSPCWRRAVFELDEWFRTQTIYTPQEVATLRADFANRVETMSLKELREVIADMEVKFQLLNSPKVAEVRAWFGQYMSVLAERRREELLRDIPNFATMSPAQLTAEINRFKQKKQRLNSAQADFNRTRQGRVDAQLQANIAAQSARQNRAAQRPAYRSPYRPRSTERPHDNVVNERPRMAIDPGGGIWRSF